MTAAVSGRRHLVLVGLMGAGKTSVGMRCAARLDRAFVDTDEVIEATTGRSVTDLFRDGEDAFRSLERQAVADACAAPDPVVVSCGGGAVLDPDNRRVMRATGTVVWLDAPARTLAGRVGEHAGGSRPLLAGGAPTVETLERLAALREPAYEAAAHVRIDTDGLGVDEVSDAVLEELARCDA